MTTTTIQPDGWVRPHGYSNGVLAEAGRILFVAGQIGWDSTKEEPTFPQGFPAQFGQALANVLAVVKKAGGRPEDVCRMTVYVSDRKTYLAHRREVGEQWRKHFGKHFPAMSLVQVACLLDDGAMVEIEATAVLPSAAR